MPRFSNEPPKTCNQHNFRLIRTPSGPPFRGFVVSEKLQGCPTHYVGNRTVPCEQTNCEPCENGMGWRWHGYLLVQVKATAELVIFEMTAAASEAFTEYYQRHGTTRGCYFQAQRVNNRPNGRVLIQAKPADLSQIHLPEPIDVKKLLAHIWNIAPNQVTTANANTRPPAESIQIDRQRPELQPAGKTYPSLPEYERAKQDTAGNGKPNPSSEQNE